MTASSVHSRRACARTYRMSAGKIWKRVRLGLALLLAIGSVEVAAEGVTIAVTGDIDTPYARVISDAILAQKPIDAVLLVGDTCNTTPAPIEQYREVYQGTYDRFLARIFPCPGNHDKLSSPPFSAYAAFWGPAAHTPEMYYSFELGAWHIVSLDSVTLRDGGTEAEKQMAWLRRDLAANPGKPSLFYWHYPLFSRAGHCGDPKMKPFWVAIYAHGPALVFNGHNHVYERFPPLDPEGRMISEATGVQEFVIGPGGAYPAVKESGKAGPPASVVFHGGVSHVGFFTLQADGRYDYTIDAIDRKGALSVVDHGVGRLQMK